MPAGPQTAAAFTYRPYAPPRPEHTRRPPTPALSERIAAASERGVIGKALATAGVAVTLIGVALLLVLAAQAGILRPEFRVAGGAALALGLVGAGVWLQRKTDGRVGAIALAATGIAAGYLDVLAVTRIYEWLPIVGGLSAAALVAAGGLVLARLWNSEHLGLLVAVPLMVLAPALTGGLDMTLVAFMIILCAASFWVQVGRDWIWLHTVRMAAPTLPLTAIAVAGVFGPDLDWRFAVATMSVIALGLGGAVILTHHSRFGPLLALIASVTTVPLMIGGAALDLPLGPALQAGTALLFVALALGAHTLPSGSDTMGQIWTATAAVLTLIAVQVAFDDDVAVAVLLGIAVIAGTLGRRSASRIPAALVAATVFWLIGLSSLLSELPPVALATYSLVDRVATPSSLAASVLLAAGAVVLASGWQRHVVRTVGVGSNQEDQVRNLGRVVWSGAALIAVYALTALCVAAGVLVAGPDGFLGGHVLATVCWVAVAAGTLVYARHRSGGHRNAVIAGGLILIVGAMLKLFLFDLATLDGVFRVIVFMIVGLALLGLGAWYARALQGDSVPGDSVLGAPGDPAQGPSAPA
ncbi:DUF2339 domain-containing protein [Gordonia sinesedis]